jgi:hypothetical protein
MPTDNRRMWIKMKARRDFRQQEDGGDDGEEQMDVEFRLKLAETHLESIVVQAKHLNQMLVEPTDDIVDEAQRFDHIDIFDGDGHSRKLF